MVSWLLAADNILYSDQSGCRIPAGGNQQGPGIERREREIQQRRLAEDRLWYLMFERWKSVSCYVTSVCVCVREGERGVNGS